MSSYAEQTDPDQKHHTTKSTSSKGARFSRNIMKGKHEEL
jgi:hypothetical protein